MVAGIDEWRINQSDEIPDDRLRRALGATALYSAPSSDSGRLVPMVRFPEWVSCQKCMRLDVFWNLATKHEDRYVNRCVHCPESTLVPSRFVTCCSAGHIQDFPYRFWVHQNADGECDPKSNHLKMRTDASDSSLAGIIVTCTCGASRSLAGALGPTLAQVGCAGRTPWLRAPHTRCSETLFGLQRGSANVWFPDVKSALTIDRSATRVEEVLDQIASTLVNVAEDKRETLLSTFAEVHDVDPSDLISTYRRQSASEAADFEQLRREEYEALGREHPEITGHEQFVCTPLTVTSDTSANGTLRSVSKVARLREVRALRGFHRVTAPAEVGAVPRGKLTSGQTSWLPAMEVLGEGVFVEFDPDAVRGWVDTEFAASRAQEVTASMRDAASDHELPAITPARLFLHSTAHALLAELALSSGYPASSIRERIYDGPDQSGILLYTATADAAGSLGGLCSHATPARVSELLASAVERAQWCSADPVCLESSASGAGAVNLAACHSCMLLPEVSCEFQNRYLDRACLVGSASNPNGGFFCP